MVENDRMEENIRYPVLPITRTREDPRYPATPVTVATPIIPLPQAPLHRPNNDDDDTRPHFRNRMFLCLLAIAFNWGTTLRIANHFASRVILVPSLDFVTSTCKSAYNITRDERLRYSKCVESQLNQCNGKLDKTMQKEDERVRKLSRENEHVVQRMEGVASNCSKSYTTLRLTLEDWMANGGEIPLHSSNSISVTSESVCSPEDQQMFNQTLLGTQNTLALQTEAMQMASAYSEESTSLVTHLTTTISDLDREISALDDYIVERAKYDANYIDEKTQHIQDSLLDTVQSFDPANIPPLDVSDLFHDILLAAVDVRACVALDLDARMADGTKCDPNLATMVDNFVEDAKWKVEVLNQTLNEYRETLYEYRDRMEEYKENAMDAYNVAKRFYDGAKAFIKIARKIVFWEKVGSWFDISDRDFFPIDVNFPDVDIAIKDVGAFDSIDAMWQKVAPKFDAFFTKVSSIPPTITARFEDLIDGIMMNHSMSVLDLIPQIVPDDYNPPTFIGTVELEINPKEVVSLYQNMSELFVTDTRAALGMFSGIGNQYDEDQLNVEVPSFNITEIKSKVTNIDLAFEDLQQPEMDFDLWFLQLSQLSDGFVLVDYIFRAYVSIRLLMRYWFATSLAMPNIDLRANKENKNPFRMHPAKATVAFATSPTGGFILFLLTSTWIIGMIAALYTPMLQSYTSGCFSASGNGTFITKNLFSLAYNHAYHDGSGILIEGMDVFDLKRGDTCSSRYTSSANVQHSMSSNFSAYKTFHREIMNDMVLARRCIDSNTLDAAFAEACCGIAGYPDCNVEDLQSNVVCPMDDRRAIMNIPIPYELPGTSLADLSCSVSTNGSDWIIKEAVFDCEQLGTCSVTCSGPRKRLLAAASERCGCTLEWYLHSKLMGSTFAFLLYVFMNIARVSFFSGITRLLWKHIYPERFTVSATCDSEGSLVTSSNISGTSHEDLINAIQTRSSINRGLNRRDLSKELRTKLDNCLRNFHATGLALLLGSLLANGVWIYALAVTSQTLTPHVWRKR
ncbi:hypothetical protein ACHAXR_010802 [Thalassiosira sp. AJA248-18]